MGKKQYIRHCLFLSKLFFLSLYLFLLSCGKWKKSRRRVIFLHSLFRSGSTYLFKKFREKEGCWCYYEPFHHELVRLKKDNLDLFRFDNETTGRMNHPNLDKPHFYEYHVAMRDRGLPFYYPCFAYDEFSSVRHQILTKHYIFNLIDSVPPHTLPLFQFNRSSLRIHWFKKVFPDSLHVYLLRAPRDQFESYYRAGKYSDNIFLAMNLYILLKNHRHWFFSEIYRKIEGVIPLSGEVNEDLSRCIYHIQSFTMEVHYEIFLHLWAASLVEAHQHADVIIDMNKLGKSKEYSHYIAGKLSSYIELPIDFFHDANLKSYDSFLLQEEQYAKIERTVLMVYSEMIPQNDLSFQQKFSGLWQ